ncbi:polysaccharide deacetylase family protein [Rhodococcus triatomae]|nr:polysaccharide deacetylase family protein [Rhodococcus triatomae]
MPVASPGSVAAPSMAPAPAARQGRAPAGVDRGALVARFEGVPATQWGTHLPGVVTHVSAGGPGRPLALTFDGCGGPAGSGVDHALLDLLERERIPATLFLNRRWIDAHPDLVRDLAAHPLFEVENHGSRHLPLSVHGRSAYGIDGTGSSAEVVDEVLDNHERIRTLTGREPHWFRAGTAHYDEVAVDIVGEIGVRIAGFAVNGDGGATFGAGQVRASLLGAESGAIVLLHLNHPQGGTAEGLEAALPELRASGTHFVLLEQGRD